MTVVASGDDYELALRGPGLDVTCHLSEGRDRPLSSGVFEATMRRVAVDLKGELTPGAHELRFSTDSDRPLEYRIAGPHPLLLWPVTIKAPLLPARLVDFAGAMFPDSILACFSNRAGHDPAFAGTLSTLVEKLVADLPPRQTATLPHYTEVELIRLDTGEMGLREVLVHRIPGGLMTSFYESVSGNGGVLDRTIYEISRDDGELVRSHFIFYRDGKKLLRSILERTGPSEYVATTEDEDGNASAPQALRATTPLLARIQMALGERELSASAGATSERYEVFAPELSREALVTLVVTKSGTPDPAAPEGTKQIGSNSAAMQRGSLSLSRAYGYPTYPQVVAPPRVTGALGK